MSIPSSGYPRTATVSPRVQVAATTDSTNADLLRHVAEAPADWPHLSVVLTTDQRSGRGRLDRTWTSPPGTGLAVSVLVLIPDVPVSARGWIPLIAGAAMTRAVTSQLRGTPNRAALKWPNDVLLDGRKLSGILAEVAPGRPEAVVIGVGVNTRMSAADLPVSTATSFAVAGLDVDEDLLLHDYLVALDALLGDLAASRGDVAASGVLREVEALCSTLGADVVVSLPDGSKLRGVAHRIDHDGRLVVVAGEVETAVSAGDVVHVR